MFGSFTYDGLIYLFIIHWLEMSYYYMKPLVPKHLVLGEVPFELKSLVVSSQVFALIRFVIMLFCLFFLNERVTLGVLGFWDFEYLFCEIVSWYG